MTAHTFYLQNLGKKVSTLARYDDMSQNMVNLNLGCANKVSLKEYTKGLSKYQVNFSHDMVKKMLV